MNSRINWVRGVAIALVATVVLAAAAAVFVPRLTQAAALSQDTVQQDTVPQSEVPDSQPQRLGPRDGGIDGGIDGEALLADALGISVDELHAARAQATSAAIDQALTEGLITEAQATRLREREGQFGPWRNLVPLAKKAINYDALLADALGISTDKLNAAKQSAQEAALAQAVADGRLTQEEADLMQARQAIQPALRERMQSIYEEVVNDAVASGTITQAQADALLSSEHGFGFEGGFGGGRGHHRRGFGGPRGFDGQPNAQPGEVTPESTDGAILPGGSI